MQRKKMLSAVFSSLLPSERAFWLSFWVSLFWLSSWARLSFSQFFSVRAGPQALALVPVLPLPAPRLRSPAPLPRSRRFLATRRPALRLLPAVTARCRPRILLSRNPFHPPLGESVQPHCCMGQCVAVLAGVLLDTPPLRRCLLSYSLEVVK